VEIEFHPIFLGGVNVGSGNKPPWSLPAKATYGTFDGDRAKKYHGITNMTTPDFFPILSILPQRCLCFIKSRHPRDKYEAAFISTFPPLWIAPHSDISKPANMATLLSKNFTAEEVEEIMTAASQPEWKAKLTANTQEVLDQGAFGAPWMMVTNSEGKREPFFGSDRFHFMWQFLGVPFTDITIIPSNGAVEVVSNEQKAKL